MVESNSLSFLTHPFLINLILPFLLIFVIVFAILQKIKILDNKGADIIVALVIGIIFIGAQTLVGFTLQIIPVISVLIVIVLAYFLIFGFMGVHQEKGIKIALGIIMGLAFIGTIVWATGLLEKFTPNADMIGIGILVAVLGGAIALVLTQSKEGGGSSK